uniref:Catenin alpha-3 n=1 Tax=Sus scrofa TaxID=9823 RepID=A0A8D1KYM2_PIG
PRSLFFSLSQTLFGKFSTRAGSETHCFIESNRKVTTLVNCPQNPSNRKKGRSKRARVLLASVEEATWNLLDKGEKIAQEATALKEELTGALQEVRKESDALKESAERFADDPCYLPKREAVVQAARALLAAVTRLLILADMIDVMCLLQHVSAVSKRWLRFTSALFSLLIPFSFFFFLLFRPAPVAYGNSQARGQIGATAAGLHHSHSNARSSCICDLHHNSQQLQILNPLSEARDRTCVLMDNRFISTHP